MEMEKNLKTAFGDFLLRPYRDDDEQQVIRLWEAAFKQKMNPAVWKWKFVENPFGRQMLLCVTGDGQPVTLYAGIPYTAVWNGDEIRMTQLIDNMSHPDFRQAVSGRKGLFVQTAEHFFNIYGGRQASIFHYGFPGLKHFKLGKIFLKYFRMSTDSTFLSANVSSVKRRFLFGGGQLEQYDVFGEEFDRLWEKVSPHFPLSAVRNSKFLNWRFTHNPIRNYLIYSLRSRNEISAYAVITINGHEASIIDILSVNSGKMINRLVRKISDVLGRDGIKTINTWLPEDHFITNALLESGFNRLSEPLGIIPTGRCFDDLDAGFVSEKIYYTMADADLF